MSAEFSVRATPRFDRLLKKLSKRHPDLAERFADALAIFKSDPHNRSRSYQIKKLQDVPAEEGQYRLRLGRWRFR